MTNNLSDPLVPFEEDWGYLDSEILDLIDSDSINLSRRQYYDFNNEDN